MLINSDFTFIFYLIVLTGHLNIIYKKLGYEGIIYILSSSRGEGLEILT